MHSGLGLLGCSEAGASQRPPCVAQQTVRIVNRGLGHVGEFCGHRQHSVFDLVTTQLGAGTQLGRDRMRACAARDRSRSLVRTAPPTAWIRCPVTAIRRIALANNPESVG
jgi:hypothetical protein